MARRIGIELFLDDVAYLRGLKRSAAGTTKFVNEIQRTGREANTGAGLFRQFGRSIAFASGGFLAFSSASEALKSVIDAGVEAAVTQRQLAAQFKASGLPLKDYQDQIDQTTLRLSALSAFTKDDLDAAFTTILRGSGNVSKALKDTALAADISRGRHVSLATASIAVGKAAAGSTTALRRLGIQLPKGATGAEALALAFRKFQGQAAAGATVQDHFATALHNTEVIVGTGLLPMLNKYLGKLTVFLNRTNKSGKLQQDVNGIVQAGAGAFDALSKAVEGTNAAYKKYHDIVSKLPGFKSGGKYGPLQTLLTPFGIPRTIIHELGQLAPTSGKRPMSDLQKQIANENAFLNAQRKKAAEQQKRDGTTARPLSLGGQFNLAELKLAQAGLTKTQADDRRILVVEAAILEKQVAGAKTLKDKVALTNQLANVQGQIVSIDQAGVDAQKAQTSELKKQNQTLKDRADAIKSAVLDRLQQRQTGVENQRALKDAQAALRTARLLGGPGGIRLAQRGVSDARFAILQARLEAAPATLRAGKFALANIITVNVHGSESPEKVAAQVVAIIQRKSRHTSTQSRGPTAGR